MINENNAAILIIDIQDKLLKAVFNKDLIKKNSEVIIKSANTLNIPVFITEQYPKGLGNTIKEIKSNLLECPNYTVEKTDFNAFANKIIYNEFKKIKRNTVIICGIETHICVYQTAIELINKGYNVILASDICGSRSEFEHKTGIESLRQNKAQIMSTEMILFNLLKSSKHPNFKEIQNLIK